jgi:hypothetical protein
MLGCVSCVSCGDRGGSLGGHTCSVTDMSVTLLGCMWLGLGAVKSSVSTCNGHNFRPFDRNPAISRRRKLRMCVYTSMEPKISTSERATNIRLRIPYDGSKSSFDPAAARNILTSVEIPYHRDNNESQRSPHTLHTPHTHEVDDMRWRPGEGLHQTA